MDLPRLLDWDDQESQERREREKAEREWLERRKAAREWLEREAKSLLERVLDWDDQESQERWARASAIVERLIVDSGHTVWLKREEKSLLERGGSPGGCSRSPNHMHGDSHTASGGRGFEEPPTRRCGFGGFSGGLGRTSGGAGRTDEFYNHIDSSSLLEGLSWDVKTAPGGSGRTDGGSPGGCSIFPNHMHGDSHTASGGRGFEEPPDRRSGRSGGSGGFSGGLGRTSGGAGRTDESLTGEATITPWIDRSQRLYCKVTFKVGRAEHFEEQFSNRDEAKRTDVPLVLDGNGQPSFTEARLEPFGHEQHLWKMASDIPVVQMMDLKSVLEGRIASVSWVLQNKVQGRRSDFGCFVEMCQHNRDTTDAARKTTRSKIPLTLRVQNQFHSEADGENSNEPSFRRCEQAHPQETIGRLMTETTLRLLRLETGDTNRAEEIAEIRQQLEIDNRKIADEMATMRRQQEVDNRRIADLEEFKNKFVQVQPSSED